MGNIICSNCDFKSPAADSLSKLELDQLEENCAQVKFQPGETIFKQDALSSNIVYLRNGIVKLHMKGPDRESILKIANAPAYLGIPTTVGDRINHYSATALVETTACFIDITAFKEFINKNGQFAYEIILDLCKNELKNFHRFVNQSQKQLNGRIADGLFNIADNVFGGSDEFIMILNRNEFSDLIGSSRESVSRVLTQFHDEGIIQISGKNIKILDRKTLQLISKNG
jgi:CRP/FNR family transcriptional regulator